MSQKDNSFGGECIRKRGFSTFLGGGSVKKEEECILEEVFDNNELTIFCCCWSFRGSNRTDHSYP